MVPLVFSLGVIAIVIGVAAIAFGIPINEFGLGNTLIVAGTTAASAGLIVVALGAVLRAIERSEGRAHSEVAAGPDIEPDIQPKAAERRTSAPAAEPRVAESEWPPQPAEPAPPRVAAGPEGGRPEMPLAGRPAWSKARDEAPRAWAPPPARAEREAPPRRARAEQPPPEPSAEPPPDAFQDHEFAAPEPSPPDEAVEAPADEAPASAGPPERRRFFTWTRRSTGAREAGGAPADAPSEPSLSESVARAEAARRTDREDREAIRRMARQTLERAPPPPEPEPELEPVAEDRVEVLRSGMVGDMSYTLYTDGSIDAEFVDGKLRFDSIEHLRRHLEEQGS